MGLGHGPKTSGRPETWHLLLAAAASCLVKPAGNESDICIRSKDCIFFSERREFIMTARVYYDSASLFASLL
eukprot:SAG22_NODE_15994_length_335_cov_0.792373_1_plen_72_part_00